MSSRNINIEFQEICDGNAWASVYQTIGRESQKHASTCTVARKFNNRPLNRYRDVNPYDHTRVKLTRADNDYINANHVEVETANRSYILTQGPLPSTVPHFWLMVWEQNSRAILMLNKLVEKKEIKCHKYWPDQVGSKMDLEDMELSIELISEEDHEYYTTRLLRIFDHKSCESRDIMQWHYTTWPDFGVPSSPDAFLDFLKKVRESGALSPEVGPAVVHCSAGIGRSGTFCLVDSCLVIYEKQGLEALNVQEVLLNMRRYRMGLIQTPDQLRFSYVAIIEGVLRLQPDYKPEERKAENIYNTPPQNIYNRPPQESPPPPPRRGASLAAQPPARPLPAIPASASMYDFKHDEPANNDSSSDENVPTYSCTESSDDEKPNSNEFKSLINEKNTWQRHRESGEQNKPDEHERNEAVRRRARDIQHWTAVKRSLYHPFTITIGVLAVSIIIYAYIKH